MSKPKAKSKVKKKLPDMTDWSDEEIAQFWETHSSADYWEELEPVEVEIVRPGKEVVALRLDKPLLEQVKAIAAAKGLAYTTLLRVWIKEKLIEATALERIRSLVAETLERIKRKGKPEVSEIDARVEPYSELVRVTIRFADGGESLCYKLHPSQLAYDEGLEERVERDLLRALKGRTSSSRKK
jgi:predicted DNA binding CopG/RHH family protein